MNILVNEKVLRSLFNDNDFNTELKIMLNEIIDEELLKEPEDMDCDLIDECTDMLIALEQENDDGFAVMIPLISSEKIMAACRKKGFKSLSRPVRGSLIACIILLSAFTANTVIADVFDYNIAKEVVSSISQTLQDWGIIASADDDSEIVVDEIPSADKADDKSDDSEPVTESKEEETTSKSKGKATQAPEKASVQNQTTPTDTAAEAQDISVQKYTLTLDANGGKCSASAVEVTYGKAIGKLPTPEREGYEFLGWYNIDISYYRENGRKNERALNEKTVYNLQKDSVVTAKWSKYSTIRLNANGGECSTEYLTLGANDSIKKLPVPTREGYIFAGWFDEDYIPFTTTENLYLYSLPEFYYELTAYWIKVGETRTVYFNTNGGKCDVSSKDFEVGKPYGELPVPVKSGFKFLGWYSEGYADSEKITADTVFTTQISLQALWYRSTATVTFDPAGGTCDVTSMNVYSDNIYRNVPKPEKEGYVFLGWYCGDEQIFDEFWVFHPAKDKTYKALWIPVKVPVTFNANGGKISSSGDISITENYSYMLSYGSLPEASRQGYKFTGWYTEPAGGTKISESDTVNFLDGATYYAHWEENETVLNVSFYLNNSDDTCTTVSVNKGEKIPASKIPNMNNSGGLFYEFDGWYTDKYYGEKADLDAVITENTEYYAHWVFNTDLTQTTLKLDKTNYELNEEIDLTTVDMILSLPSMGYSQTITGEMLVEAGAKIEYDTSSYGKHTLTVTVAMDTGYMLTLRASADIYVGGCTHESGTYTANEIAPTCHSEGYSGDIMCKNCNELIEKGSVLPMTQHDENTKTKTINYKAATCSEEGYSGDSVCVECGKIVKKGSIINKTPHTSTHQEVAKKASFDQDGEIVTVCNDCNTVISTDEIISKVSSVTLSSEYYEYDGYVKSPKVTVKDANGNIIKDYTVTMDEGRTQVGTYNVYVTLNGNLYEGEKNLTFEILECTLRKPDAKFVSGTSYIEWSANPKADGYEVYCEKLFGEDETYTITSNNITYVDYKKDLGYKFPNYYKIKVRAYKNIKDGVIYSPWSDLCNVRF